MLYQRSFTDFAKAVCYAGIGVTGSAWEQHFVREVIELHDKYMLYVGDCFANSSLFHKALKEAFEFFCNKNVAGSSTAELMANFCDNLLRKVCAMAVTVLVMGTMCDQQLSCCTNRCYGAQMTCLLWHTEADSFLFLQWACQVA